MIGWPSVLLPWGCQSIRIKPFDDFYVESMSNETIVLFNSVRVISSDQWFAWWKYVLSIERVWVYVDTRNNNRDWNRRALSLWDVVIIIIMNRTNSEQKSLSVLDEKVDGFGFLVWRRKEKAEMVRLFSSDFSSSRIKEKSSIDLTIKFQRKSVGDLSPREVLFWSISIKKNDQVESFVEKRKRSFGFFSDIFF